MRILLCCNAGMSSSIIVKNMRKAAERRGLDAYISSLPNAEIRNEKNKWDICLVGPQLKYTVENIKATLNIPVESIDPRIYALADGEKALDLALKLYDGQDENE